MSEVQRTAASNEPGHRYTPRRASPRYMEVHTSARRSFGLPKETLKSDDKPVSLQSDTASEVPIEPIPKAPAAVKVRGTVKPALPRLNRSTVLRRQIVDKAAQYKKQNQDQRRRNVMAFAFGGTVATLLVGGIFTFYALHQPKEQVLSANVTRPNLGGVATGKNSATASEAPVTQTDIDTYTVAANHPRIIRVTSLGVQARIYPVRTDLNGELLPTNNIYDVGWLSAGAKPGESGAALFNGYVAGSTKNGTFGNLVNLSVGDVVQVERGDGKVLRFKVIRSQQYPANAVDMQAVTHSAIAGKPGLNLLTNTGRFDVRNNQFEPRTVVFTVLE